jgi:hypothetical protein
MFGCGYADRQALLPRRDYKKPIKQKVLWGFILAWQFC